jgi:hypothetical protein
MVEDVRFTGCKIMSKIELTTKQLFGIVLMIIGIVLFFYVIVNAILLVNGTVAPLRIQSSNLPTGFDVLLGIALQIGLFGLLVGVGFGLAKIGLEITKN